MIVAWFCSLNETVPWSPLKFLTLLNASLSFSGSVDPVFLISAPSIMIAS